MILVYAGTNKTKTNDFAVIRTIQSNIVTKADFRERGLGLHEQDLSKQRSVKDTHKKRN